MRNEALLVSRAAMLGDKDAYGQLVTMYQSPVRRFFSNLTGGDSERSKDLAQETFIRAWMNIGSFRAAATFSTWLYRIAYNIFYDDVRSTKSTDDIDEALDAADEATPNTDLSMDFKGALAQLRPDERSAMLLFYMEDLSVARIATIMNCPEGTIKSHLHRGKEKMSVYLKNYKI
jgi:RNA polymerase sigma-70 factor (ECF subfamily)